MQLKKIMMLLALCSSHAYADGFSASVGTDYSTGQYGSNESTDVLFMPFQFNYETGPVMFKVTVPYLRVTGPGDIVPSGLGGSGSGSTVATGSNGCNSNSGKGNARDRPECQGLTDDDDTSTPTTPTTTTTTTKRKRTTESGLGDVTLAAIYNLIDNPDSGWIVDLTGRVKIPTASESKGLGSGKTDYAVQANVDKYFGAFNLSAGLGYRWLGEPSGVNYDNVTYGSIGSGYKFSKATSMGFSYDWATAAVNGGAKPQEVSVFGSYRLNDNYKLSAVLYGGLSNASPDVGGGLTLHYYF